MQVLPFYRHDQNISFNHPALYNLSKGALLPIMCPANELLPFICPLPTDYNGTLSVIVRQWPSGRQVMKAGRNEFNHRIMNSKAGRFVVYDGGAFACLDLDVCGHYYLQINQYVSEVFTPFLDPYGLLKFTLSSSINVAGLPYDEKFKQYFYTKGFIQPPDFEPFQNTSSNSSGKKVVTYSRLTKNFSFNFEAVRPCLQAVFASLSLVEKLTIQDIYSTINVDARQAKVSFSDKQNWWSTVSVTVPDLESFDTNICTDNKFTDDPKFAGITNATACPPESLLLLPDAQCLDILEDVEASCDEIASDLNFMVQIIK